MKTTLLTLAICLGSIIGFAQDLDSFKDENGKFGYKDKEGKVVIPAEFDDVARTFNSDEKLTRVKLNEKYGFINHEGKRVIDIIYDDSGSEPDENGVIYLEKNDKYALADQAGNLIIDFKYEWLVHAVDTFYRVGLNEKMGIVSLHGVEIIPTEFEYVYPYGKNAGLHTFAATKDRENWGLVDEKNKTLLPFKYSWNIPYSECCFDYQPVMLPATKKWTYSNKEGNFLTDFKYDWTGHFIGNIAPIMIKNKYGFLNKNMKEICPVKYDDFGYYAFDSTLILIPVNQGAIAKTITEEDGYTWVERNGGKWGFINQQGKEVIPVKYNSVDIFS